MTDLVWRLRAAAEIWPIDHSVMAVPAMVKMLKEAADEIEHLRSVAGAVSRGPSHRDLRGGLNIGKLMGPPPEGVVADIGLGLDKGVVLSKAECLAADAEGISWVDYAKRKHSSQELRGRRPGGTMANPGAAGNGGE